MYVLIVLGMAGVCMIAGALIFFIMKYQHKLLSIRLKAEQTALEHQKKLLYTALQSQEEERERIGRDLHDEVCGALSNLQFVYSRARGVADTELLHQQLGNIIEQTRSISHQLSPPGLSLFGLHDAVEDLCDQWRNRGALHITVINEAREVLQQGGFHTILPLYRIVQELLSNTVKHAGASEVLILFSLGPTVLVMSYQDNGCGLAPDYQRKKGMGLDNIISRSGMLGAAYSISGAGVRPFSINIRIPL